MTGARIQALTDQLTVPLSFEVLSLISKGLGMLHFPKVNLYKKAVMRHFQGSDPVVSLLISTV